MEPLLNTNISSDLTSQQNHLVNHPIPAQPPQRIGFFENSYPLEGINEELHDSLRLPLNSLGVSPPQPTLEELSQSNQISSNLASSSNSGMPRSSGIEAYNPMLSSGAGNNYFGQPQTLDSHPIPFMSSEFNFLPGESGSDSNISLLRRGLANRRNDPPIDPKLIQIYLNDKGVRFGHPEMKLEYLINTLGDLLEDSRCEGDHSSRWIQEEAHKHLQELQVYLKPDTTLNWNYLKRLKENVEFIFSRDGSNGYKLALPKEMHTTVLFLQYLDKLLVCLSPENQAQRSLDNLHLHAYGGAGGNAINSGHAMLGPTVQGPTVQGHGHQQSHLGQEQAANPQAGAVSNADPVVNTKSNQIAATLVNTGKGVIGGVIGGGSLKTIDKVQARKRRQKAESASKEADVTLQNQKTEVAKFAGHKANNAWILEQNSRSDHGYVGGRLGKILGWKHKSNEMFPRFDTNSPLHGEPQTHLVKMVEQPSEVDNPEQKSYLNEIAESSKRHVHQDWEVFSKKTPVKITIPQEAETVLKAPVVVPKKPPQTPVENKEVMPGLVVMLLTTTALTLAVRSFPPLFNKIKNHFKKPNLPQAVTSNSTNSNNNNNNGNRSNNFGARAAGALRENEALREGVSGNSNESRAERAIRSGIVFSGRSSGNSN